MKHAAWFFCSLIFVSSAPLPLRAEDNTPKLINLKTVNTAADEMDPHPSSTSRALFFSSNAKGKWDILVATRSSTSQMWGKPRILGGYVKTEADDRSVFYKDGRYPQYLYYATQRDKEQGNYDIYAALRVSPARSFSAPTPINTIATEADEMHPWLTSDGRALLFSRKTEEGWRVFLTTRRATTGASGFGEAKLLSDIPVGYRHPTLSPDKKSLYLEGPVGADRSGLFLSRKLAKGWSKPLPLNINSEEGKVGDRSPCLTRTGKWLYFASDRPGGTGKMDLYIVRTADLKVVEPGE